MDRHGKDLEDLHRRLELVLAHQAGKSIAAIAREHSTSRQTVKKWVDRFAESGVDGLLSEKSPGRPPEIHPVVREEVVRLARETRPPIDLGDQWTAESLGAAFGVSSSWVSQVWREAGFDPPQHIQQVEYSPDRMVPLKVDLLVPAWFKLHLEVLGREQGKDLHEHIWEALAGKDPLREWREDALRSLRERWTNANERLPRADPRSREYRREIERREEGKE